MLAVLGLLGMVSSASAATLTGPWAPFTNCPVDDPAMLAVPPEAAFGAACVSSTSPSGSFKAGTTTLQTGSTALQFGIADAKPDGSNLGQVVPATEGKTLVADPVDVPGGVLGLMCPSNLPLISSICRQVVGSSLNRVTATVETAGSPSDFNALGALVTGIPIVTLPVKIHLVNSLLGPSCFIGSNANPIILRPETTTPGTIRTAMDPNGFQVGFLQGSGAVLGDDSFAVPGASGCGPLGLASGAINSRQGLPAPAGQNEVVLGDVASSLALTPAGGQVLSQAWHASAQP